MESVAVNVSFTIREDSGIVYKRTDEGGCDGGTNGIVMYGHSIVHRSLNFQGCPPGSETREQR